MKSVKVARYQIEDTMASVRNYYIVFISIIAILIFISLKMGTGFNSSGLEFSTVIFLFVLGLNSLRSGFLFTQSNNISRKAFYKGAILGVLSIACFMSIIDIIINRTYNIFVKSPTNFDMIYGSFRDIRQSGEMYRWSMANDIGTLLGTFTWQYALYSMAFISGILISMIYYRSNKIMKVIISVIPFILLFFSYKISALFPISVWQGLGNFIANAFGWYSRNPYIAVLSFSILGTIFAGFSYLLIRKAVVK